jgi:hypothetical protein
MKKRHSNIRTLKQLFVAIPAAALMLGISQAGTSVGINFQGSYGGSYAGALVTAPAFGLPATNWFSDPTPAYSGSMSVTPASGGSLSVDWNSADVWCAGLYPNIVFNGTNYTTPNPLPGDPEVLWGYLDDPSPGASVTISGLNSVFSNGYVLQTIAAEVYIVDFTNANVAYGVTNENLNYEYYWNPPNFFGPPFNGYGTAALSAQSSVLTNDSIGITGGSPGTDVRAPLCGFILTDVPVVTYTTPASTVVAPGSSFVLTASVIGIGNLSYQWQLDGTNIPGATFVNYTNNAAALTDAGNYQLTAMSDSFPTNPATGALMAVTVNAPEAYTWDANTNASGTHPLDGSGTWTAAGTNWWTGSVDAFLYPNDAAAFGAGGTGTYTVTLGDNVTVGAITFNSGDYTITNTALGESLTLQGAAEITANTNATISAPISTGTGTFTTAGAGTLISSGDLICGQTFVSAGTLEVLKKSADSPYVITNGATLEIGYSPGGGYANTGMQIYGDGTSATTGLYLAGGTIYNVSGTPTLMGAPTTIRQYGSGPAALGIFDINSTGLLCSIAASGSIIDSNIQMVSDGYGMAALVDAGANTATGDLILNGPLAVGDDNGPYGFYKRGAGSVRLNAVALDTNCALDIVEGSVICGIEGCIGSNASLEISEGATLNFNGTSQTVFNLLNPRTDTPGLAGTLSMSINKGGTPSSTVLTEDDGGVMLLTGNLFVTNVGGTLALGDTFTLFSSGGGYSNGLENITLPPLANGLGWTNNLGVDGTISVVTGGGPQFVTDLSGTTNYVYAGGNSTYSISVNGDLPLSYEWLHNGTTSVSTNGPTLTLSSLTVADSGSYSITRTNAYGTAHSKTNYLEVLPPSGYAALIASAGPVSFWPLDDASGTTAIDYWSGYNAIYTAGYTLDQQTNPVTGTGSVLFDGTTGYALTPYYPALNPTVFSAEAWVNPDAAPTSEFCVLCCGQFATSGRSGWLIYQFPTYWNLRTYYANGTATAVDLQGVSSPAVGSWTHLAATWDGTTARLYVNGTLEGSQVPTNTPNYVPGVSGGFCVGARADLAFFWGGNASDAALYNRVLSAQEIAAHAHNVPSLGIALAGTNVVLTWTGAAATVQASPTLSGAFTNVSGATTSPWTNTPAGETMFYRLKF